MSDIGIKTRVEIMKFVLNTIRPPYDEYIYVIDTLDSNRANIIEGFTKYKKVYEGRGCLTDEVRRH